MSVKNLIAGKKNIDEKLMKLEKMKGEIKEKIYEKIKNEYLEKLEQINIQINENRGHIEEEIEKIEVEQKKIADIIDKHNTDMEEIEIRKTLNDIDENQYVEKKNEIENEINRMKLRYDEFSLKKAEYDAIPGISVESVTKGNETPEPENPENTIIERENFENFPIKHENKDIPAVDENDSPINDILQPQIDTLEEGEQEEGGGDIEKMESLKKLFNPDEASKEQSEIEGLKCPKCGHINRTDLFNCEKCGSELL